MKIKPDDISRAINASQSKFHHFRKARAYFMSAYVGRFYGKDAGLGATDGKASPLNLLNTAVNTIVPNLVFSDPRVKARTEVLAFRPYSEVLELATNHLIRQIRLRQTLRHAIVDSMFMAGFVKTGLATTDDYIEIEGTDYPIGQPYAERVDPDDMILDPMARDWDEQAFLGNKFRVDVDTMLETGLYDEDELERAFEINATNGGFINPNEAKDLSGRSMGSHDTRRYIDLCEVYFPREKRIVTMPYTKDKVQDKFIREADYMGPDTGPYHMLGYGYVPDNLLPVAPVGMWYDMNTMANRIARKLARQSERIKQVLAYEPTAQDDVDEIADAEDGETVPVENIDRIREVQFGGTSDAAYNWMEWVKRNFSEQAGSLDMLSGSGSNAPTATQAEMLQANTSVRLSDMQGMVYEFTAKITNDLAFYLHTDPLIELPLVRRQEGQEVQVYYTPEMRQGDWFDFNIDIEPFSMARPDPNMAVRRKLEFATNVIPAAAQAMAMLGPGFNVGAYLARMAKEVGIEDAGEWLNTPEVQQWVMQRLLMSGAYGDAGKAGQYAMLPGLPQPVMGNPNQPLPTARGPSDGISPMTERAMAQQETSGELQSSREPSARALALSQ